MKRFIIALALLLPNAAGAWDLDQLNKAIEQTNFIVGRGCSGTLIDLKQQLVLTNYHCVDGQISSYDTERTTSDGTVKKVKVRRYVDVGLHQSRYDGFAMVGSANFVSEIVAEHKQRDLAVLKIKGTIPHVYASPLLADGGRVVRGERVYVVGNPALEESTLVEGVVSNVNRTYEFPWTDEVKLPMIQFSGGIYGGNSGGALYNDNGELIGVPAAGYAAANFIGLAIPVTIVKAFLRDNCLASVFDDKADDAACQTKKAEKVKKDTE